MANAAVTKKAFTYLLGVCVPSSKETAAKIRVRRLKFDEHLLMYFNKFEFFYASDPERRCKIGDTVLIQNLPEKLTRVITHKVIDVIYPLGDITDPITGKKVVASNYRDAIDEDSALFGELKSKYKYDKAPERGSMANKRDFTDRQTYMKYCDDPEHSDPYAVNPS